MALSLKLWLDRSSLRPDVAGTTHLVLELEASGNPPEGVRPAATTVLAIDVSGSMQGTPIEQVIRSVDRLLDGLRPEDQVGVVAFSSGATVVVEPSPCDAAGKNLVRSRVSRLFAEGQTNVEAGLELAAATLGAPVAMRRRGVVLLSDGVPNEGVCTAAALRDVVRRHRPGIAFSSLGYGVKHDEDILGAIGDAGGGGYAFVPDPATCARAFARALGMQADVVADGIELVIAPSAGVEVVRLLGDLPLRFGHGGLAVSLPDLVPGARRLVIAELRTKPPGSGAEARLLLDLAEVQVSWRTPGSSTTRSQTQVATIEIAAREPAPVVEAMRRVLLVRSDDVRQAARAKADRREFALAAALLRGVLASIARVPGFVMGESSPLGEAYELLVDEAMAMERNPGAEAYEMFRKSATASRLALHAPPAASSRGPASTRLLEHAAGRYPAAALVVLNGATRGERHVLREECVIGRTASADLAVPSDGVSRRHAEVYALEGEFWVCDLGSTNVTTVNGQSLGSTPAKLRSGDILRLGTIELRYEEIR